MNRMVRFWARDDRASRPRVPAGVRIYAVGDIHGHDDLAGQLLDAIERDIAGLAPARNVLVFLGDLIDRGPDSAAVVERLRTFHRHSRVFLAGNHEEILLRILDGEERLIADWLRFGGAQCLQSYGVDPARVQRMRPAESLGVIRNAVPSEHQQFLRSFADSFSAGDYLFVHAGIRPNVPLDQQSRSDLRWIRSPFLECADRHAMMVVHGHSISKDVEFRPGRIGVDTGAYRTGLLSALVLEGADQRVVQVRGTAGGSVERAGRAVEMVQNDC